MLRSRSMFKIVARLVAAGVDCEARTIYFNSGALEDDAQRPGRGASPFHWFHSLPGSQD